MADEIAQDPRPECTRSATSLARAVIPRPIAGDSASRRVPAKPRPPTAHTNASNGQSRPGSRVQSFDNRQQIIVHSDEIKPGDWLNDRGTLRQVESVYAVSLRAGPGMIHILHFKAQPGVASTVLGFSGCTAEVTVWRAT